MRVWLYEWLAFNVYVAGSASQYVITSLQLVHNNVGEWLKSITSVTLLKNNSRSYNVLAYGCFMNRAQRARGQAGMQQNHFLPINRPS